MMNRFELDNLSWRVRNEMRTRRAEREAAEDTLKIMLGFLGVSVVGTVAIFGTLYLLHVNGIF